MDSACASARDDDAVRTSTRSTTSPRCAVRPRRILVRRNDCSRDRALSHAGERFPVRKLPFAAKYIAASLRALRWIAPVLPDRLLHPPASLRRPVAWWFGATTAAHAQLFAEMLASTPIEFIRWTSNAVASWKGVAELSMPIHHVHGERDRLIPVRRVQADRVIASAGHLLNMTHAADVNAFIAGVDQRGRGGR